MSTKILLVDDDPNILAGFKRNLRKKFDIDTADGGQDGLRKILETNVEYAVVVSDMQMPEMDGVEFLKRVAKITPNTVRMMLTGNADQNTAIQAINEGRIFRFLNKPCSTEKLAAAIDEGITQYRLIAAEKEILETTLSGSIQVVCEILSLVNPVAFGKASRIQRLVGQLCKQLDLPDCWKLEMAAMLSQLGCVTIPPDVLEKFENGDELDAAERKMITSHPSVAGSLLKKIPRMEDVADLIGCQIVDVPLEGRTDTAVLRQFAVLESCVLQIAIDCDTYQSSGCQPHVVFERIKNNNREYWPEVVASLEKVVSPRSQRTRAVSLAELICGDVLAADVTSDDGRLLVRNGQEITVALQERLSNFSRKTVIQQPLFVYDQS